MPMLRTIKIAAIAVSMVNPVLSRGGKGAAACTVKVIRREAEVADALMIFGNSGRQCVPAIDTRKGTKRGDPDHITSCPDRRGYRHHQVEATMRWFFLIVVVLLSATTAHAGLDLTVADADVRAPEAIQPIKPLSAQRPDAGVLAEKRQAMVQQKMMMQKQMMIRKQMAMQREMQRHPIRTRVHFAILTFKRKMHYAFR
jgi:hypothetical protein